jgi:hypothetical protein
MSDVKKLVEDLRALAFVHDGKAGDTCEQAAALLSSQAEEVERLREALLSVFDEDMNFRPLAIANFCGLARQALGDA